MMKATLKGSTTVGDEEISVMVERPLAFLDTWTMVEPDGLISMEVFRKDIHTDQYLSFSSNHLLEHKKGVVRTLMNRANILVSEETELEMEKKHIRKALKVNGYPDWMLADFPMSDYLDPGQEENEDVREGEDEDKEVEQRMPATTIAPEGPQVPRGKKKYPVVLPYVRGISEKLRRVFRSFHIPAYFKLTNTLWQLLVWPKDKIEKGKVVGPVYHNTCYMVAWQVWIYYMLV